MANPTLSAIMWGLALLVSALAVLSFARGLTHMWRTVSAGTPDPGRLGPVGKRAWGVVSAALTHREFKGRPWIKAAHWLVMVSFPILFFTPGHGLRAAARPDLHAAPPRPFRAVGVAHRGLRVGRPGRASSS